MNPPVTRIRNRIHLHEGRLLNVTEGPNESRLFFYRIGATVCILQAYTGDLGIALYTEAPISTMEDAEAVIDRLAALPQDTP